MAWVLVVVDFVCVVKVTRLRKLLFVLATLSLGHTYRFVSLPVGVYGRSLVDYGFALGILVAAIWMLLVTWLSGRRTISVLGLSLLSILV